MLDLGHSSLHQTRPRTHLWLGPVCCRPESQEVPPPPPAAGDRHLLPPGAWPLTCAVSLKVRDSLPAAMLRHVDAGGVQMEVTRVANGSVVVEFNLLIIADVDVLEVSAAFLVALRNASLLEVVGEDTFIQGRRRPGPPVTHRVPEARWGEPSTWVSSGSPCRRCPVWNTQAPRLSYGYCAISGGLRAQNILG